ncbi:MAG: T9SS C-terminal target domain-containing protein [Cyclobacteriaceae bacterium]
MRGLIPLFFLVMCLYGPVVQGQVIVEGVYQGKNLYVQNPLSEDNRSFCAESIFVNDRLVYDQPNTSAFEIDLSFLQRGASLTIRIEHKRSCEPKIINPQVIRSPGSFSFNYILADKNAITWHTEGERSGGRFFLEKWVNGEWTIEHTLGGKGEAGVYLFPVEHFAGTNRYRVKHLQNDGIIFYSEENTYECSDEPVTFYPQRVAEKIVLSKATDYKVTNIKGMALAKGRGKEIPLQHLRSGVYYLYIENRQEKFFKK